MLIPSLEGVHLGHDDRQMLLILKRGKVRYVMRLNYHRPCDVRKVDGYVTTSVGNGAGGDHSLGWGAENKGTPDFTLDPVCGALFSKGWSPERSVHARYCNRSWQHDFPVSFNVRPETLSVRNAYSDIRERYWISDRGRHALTRPGRSLGWAILVDHRPIEEEYRATSFSIDVQISVPRLYRDPKSFAALLKAIEGLPSAQDIQDIHPAQRAAG